MKLLYLSNMKMPSEKAHSVQVANTCAAFAGQGLDVELVAVANKEKAGHDIFSFHEIKKNFTINFIQPLSLKNFGKIGLLLRAFFFAVAAWRKIISVKADILYIRGPYVAYFISFLAKKYFLELHLVGGPSFLMRRIINKSAGLIVITSGIKQVLMEKYKILPKKILVAPDGVSPEVFDLGLTVEQARERLNLPRDKKIICYEGSFYSFNWKGVDVLLEAASILKNKNLLFLFIGGNQPEIAAIKQKYRDLNNLMLLEKKPNPEISFYLKAADVLVLPNKSGDAMSELYTSPMKMFEYMMAAKPIVASGLPSIKEVLNDGNSFLIEPNNPFVLAEAIEKVLANEVLAKEKSKRAYTDAQQYTWDKRARNIKIFLEKCL